MASLNISLKIFPLSNLEIIFIAGIFFCVIIIFIHCIYIWQKEAQHKHIMNAGLLHQIVL